MRWATHLNFGLFLALSYFFIAQQDISWWNLFITLIFSILPDIDEFSSKISKKTRPFSFILNIFKHRGFFHSMLFMALIVILFGWLGIGSARFALMGIMGHIVMDMLSGSVILFWPFSRRRYRLIKMPEPIVFWSILVLNVGLIVIQY